MREATRSGDGQPAVSTVPNITTRKPIGASSGWCVGPTRPGPAPHRHYERGLRSCLGLMRLEKTCGADRLEAACRRALDLGSASYRTVCWILKQGADRLPIAGAASSTVRQLPLHENIRGPEYYS